MFLNRLDLVEKEAFISLAVKAAEANGQIADEEYQMIEEYCKEMGIAFFDAKNLQSLDKIVRVYSEASEQHKKIAVLELVGLMYADGGYDLKERAFVNDFVSKIGVSEDTLKKIEDTIVKYVDMTRELLECIAGNDEPA